MVTKLAILSIAGGALALSGCTTAPSSLSQAQKDQLSRQMEQQCKTLPSRVERARCEERVFRTAYRNAGIELKPTQDLLFAKYLEIAERVDAGEITEAQGRKIAHEYVYEIVSQEEQSGNSAR